VNTRTPSPSASTDSQRADGQTSLAAQCIRALLDRAALPRHRHSAHIAGLLKLSYHQAHRRMTGIAPWSLEELQAVASHHGETLVDLFGEQKSADYETAVLIAGPLRVTCRLWPGQPLAQHRPGDLIALKGGSEWVVMVAGETPTPLACTVRRLIIEPKPDRPRRFAILDDDLDIARGLAAGLIELGFEATAFATEAQLEAALQFDSFDGYVIDWVLANGTAEALVARLRSQSATCPIALLTGKAGSKEVDEKDLVAAIEQHGLLFLQKPVTASIAASQFSAAFANR
jgi:ActR/RegA family two-component response regulator